MVWQRPRFIDRILLRNEVKLHFNILTWIVCSMQLKETILLIIFLH